MEFPGFGGNRESRILDPGDPIPLDGVWQRWLPVPGYRVLEWPAMSAKKSFTTGHLALAAEVGVETLRYYERRGLLREPPRTPAGHRRYDDEDLRRLRFIRRAQTLGFQLDEIRELLDVKVHVGEPGPHVADATDRVMSRIDEKLATLRSMRASLARLRKSCDGNHPPGHCPILKALEVGG